MTKSILLIEPDPMLLEQYERKLLTQFDVFTARNAQTALDILDDKSKPVDLVLMDVNIDKNNGIEFVHEMRSYDDWIDLPIVLLSSVPESRFPLDRLKRYGVVTFLYKPHTSPREVVVQVSRALQR